jgi:RHS repeat-associated protein
MNEIIYAKVETYNNYYPFGMLMPGRNGASGDYRYGFNGKEMDNDMSGGTTGATYDYGFRIYDSRIAKFLSVDPLMASYPELTPYQFASNTPIAAIDLDGLEGYRYTEYYERQDGKKIPIRHVVEVQLYVVIVQNDPTKLSYEKADIGKIESRLNTVFENPIDKITGDQKFKYAVDGALVPIEFRFVMHSYEIPAPNLINDDSNKNGYIELEEYRKYVEKSINPSLVGNLNNVLNSNAKLRPAAFIFNYTESENIAGQNGMNTIITRGGRYKYQIISSGHEMTHLFYSYLLASGIDVPQGKDPSHNDPDKGGGGSLSYIHKDEPINQKNLDYIIWGVPEIQGRVIRKDPKFEKPTPTIIIPK